MKPVIDLTKEYGLVLEGGGAKGAYQIGAWKAMREAGVKIKGIAGTSVGALNGALICMDDLTNAEKVWEIFPTPALCLWKMRKWNFCSIRRSWMWIC